VVRAVVLIVMLPMLTGFPPLPVYVISTEFPAYSSRIPVPGWGAVPEDDELLLPSDSEAGGCWGIIARDSGGADRDRDLTRAPAFEPAIPELTILLPSGRGSYV